MNTLHGSFTALFLGLVVALAPLALLPAQNAQKLVRAVGVGLPPPAPEEDEARERTEPDGEIKPSEPSPPVFFLRDGGKVAGAPRLEALDVRTRYGVLRIPLAELVQVRFAQRIDASLKKQVQELIARLGDEDFDAREDAMEALRRIGAHALPFIRLAAESDNEEIKSRSGILAGELEALKESQAGAGDAPSGVEGIDDQVQTTRMTIKGQVLAEDFVIQSRYGSLRVSVGDLKAVSFRQSGPTSAKFDVLPKNQPPGSWMDTKFDLEAGQRFRLEASGIINVTNYSVSCGPAGTREWGGQSWNNFAQLALVGRIGKNGKPFLVGDEYRGKADKAGRLYLAIVAFSYNPAGAVGKYTVKLRSLGGE